MPQMDSVTFLPQVFWLLVVFSVFYLIIADKVLPTMSRILKTRSKKLSQGKEISNLAASEENILLEERSNTFVKSSKNTQDLLLDFQSNVSEWEKVQAKPLVGGQKKFNLSYFSLLSTFAANKTRFHFYALALTEKRKIKVVFQGYTSFNFKFLKEIWAYSSVVEQGSFKPEAGGSSPSTPKKRKITI